MWRSLSGALDPDRTGNWDYPTVELQCAKCGRQNVERIERCVARYGDIPMLEMIRRMSAERRCPQDCRLEVKYLGVPRMYR